MRSDLLHRLRPSLQALVADLEAATGIEIEVRAALDRPKGEKVQETLDSVLGVIIGAGSIVIETPMPVSEFDDDAGSKRHHLAADSFSASTPVPDSINTIKQSRKRKDWPP